MTGDTPGGGRVKEVKEKVRIPTPRIPLLLLKLLLLLIIIITATIINVREALQE